MTKASQLTLNSSKNIQRSLSLIATGATAMAAGVIASLTAVIDKAEDYSFSVQRMADATGTTSEMFSKLAYSAKLSGTPVETLSQGMERLARTAFAAKNGTKESVSAFSSIGINLQDLQGPLRDSGDLMVAVAKKLDGYAESTNKTGLEQKLLGRSGAELNPLLKQLASGFDTASQQATLFGVVIGDKTASQARQLHQSMVQVESVALGLSLRLLSGVSPALEDVAGKILKVVTSSDGMRTVESIAGSVATSIRLTGDAFVYLADHATAVKAVLGTVAALQVGKIFVPMIAGAVKAGTSLDAVGLAALQMVERASGLTALGRVFVPLITGAYGTASAMVSLAASEGIAAAGAYGVELALAALATPIAATAGVMAILTAGIGAVGYALLDAKKKAEQSTGVAVTWGDTWGGALDQVADKLLTVKLYWDKITGAVDEEDSRTQKLINTYGLLGKTLDMAVADRAKGRDTGFKNYGNAESIADHKAKASKTAAPNIPIPQTEKVDSLKLKMDELAASAKAAQQALADAGKGIDLQRANEITQEYEKTIIELEAKLKAQHKTLSEGDKSAIRTSIATRINGNSQADFINTLARGTEQINAQTFAADLLTAAIGRGAAAVRAAQVDAEMAEKTAGQSPEWLRLNAEKLSQERTARIRQLAASDAGKDGGELDGIRQQITMQQALNAAVLAGRSAMEEARLASDKAAIRKSYADRGDTNQPALEAELAKTEELFRLKQSEADLSRAASMDAARAYSDEAAAIRDAAKAAQDAGQPLSGLQVSAAQKSAWLTYLDSIDRTVLAVGSASDGVSVFFQQMSRQTESAAQQVHDVLGGAFESLNGMLEKLISGQKQSFAEFFRGIAAQFGKIAIQKSEQAVAGTVLNKLGIGGAANNPQAATTQAIRQGNQTLVNMSVSLNSILDTMRSGAGISGGSLSGLGALGGASSDANGSGFGRAAGGAITPVLAGLIPGGGFLTGLGGLFGGLFGGHKALGGSVQAGVTYDVGEMGREEFTPSQDGKITPNKDLRNGSPTFHIDARGANDPAQTEAAIHRAMQSYGPAISKQTIKAMDERNMRRAAPSR